MLFLLLLTSAKCWFGILIKQQISVKQIWKYSALFSLDLELRGVYEKS